MSDAMVGIHNILQSILTEYTLVFVVVNLSNISCVDLKSVDGMALICEHDHHN